MDYLTAMEVSKKWHISNRMVAYYCEAGRVDGAVKKGKTWFIPIDAEKPSDKRRSEKAAKIRDNSKLQEDISVDTTAIYHTGDVYSHLGFTRETLRYYEDIGLIKPKRSRNSQYREFDFYDMSYLMTIDFYKKRGFTPIEIKRLLKVEKSEEYEKTLQNGIEYLQSNIESLNGMLRRLKDAKNFYHYAINNNGKFEIRTMPSYYVQESIGSLASFDEYQDKVLKYINRNEDILSNMVRVLTFDETGYKGSGIYIVKPSSNVSIKNHNTFLEGGKCLYTICIADSNDNSVMEKMFI